MELENSSNDAAKDSDISYELVVITLFFCMAIIEVDLYFPLS